VTSHSPSYSILSSGDSYCRFSSYSINGTLGGRVSASAERDLYTSPQHLSENKRIDPNEVSYCGPREQDGVGRMARIGQVIAAPVGHAVLIMHISRLNIVPRVCTGGSEKIVQVALSSRVPSQARRRSLI
jgi:hypothetical protein